VSMTLATMVTLLRAHGDEVPVATAGGTASRLPPTMVLLLTSGTVLTSGTARTRGVLSFGSRLPSGTTSSRACGAMDSVC